MPPVIRGTIFEMSQLQKCYIHVEERAFLRHAQIVVIDVLSMGPEFVSRLPCRSSSPISLLYEKLLKANLYISSILVGVKFYTSYILTLVLS